MLDLDSIIRDRFLNSTIKIYKNDENYELVKRSWCKDVVEFDVRILAVSDLEMNDCYDGYGDDMKVVLTLEKQEDIPFNTLNIWVNQGNEVFELTPLK